MAVQLALSTGVVPGLDAAGLAALLGRLGLAGVEIPLADVEKPPALLADAAATRAALVQHRLAVAAVATGINLDGADRHAWQKHELLARRAIELAAAVGAGVVRFVALRLGRGQTRAEAYEQIAARLRALAEHGATVGVRVALQNGGAFATARDLWNICQLAGDSGAGAAWSVGLAAAAGESPAVSVPTLNRQIVYATAWDASSAEWRVPVTAGTGDVKIRNFIERLRGIGYNGWLCYAPPRGQELTGTALDEHLYAAAKLLREVAGLPELGPDGKPVAKEPEKPAAAPARPAAKAGAGTPAKSAAAAKPAATPAKPAAPAKPAEAAAPKPAAGTAPQEAATKPAE